MRNRTILSAFVLSWAVCIAACGGPQQQQPQPTPTEEPPPPPETTMVRFVHAIPDGPAVEAWVGETSVASGVGFMQWGDWTQVLAGEQDLNLRRGELSTLSDSYTFRPNEYYLVVAYGTLSPMGDEVPASFMILQDERLDDSEDDVFIRFANTVADGEAYGLVITTGGGWDMLFPNQPVGTISEYKRGPLYDNTLEVIPAHNTSLPAVYEFEQNLQLGIRYTFIVTGRRSNDTLDVFAVTDAQSLRQ